MTGLIIVVVLTLSISAMCSLFEATLYSTRVASLEAVRSSRKRRSQAERFLAMKREIAVPTAAILILNTVANTGGAAFSGMYASTALGVVWVPAFSVLLTLAILLLSEIFPKTYGVIHWRRLWPLIVWPLAGLQRVFYPFIRIIQKLTDSLTAGSPAATATEAEIMSMIRLGARSGELTPTELRLLDAVFHFDQLSCRQVMLPRPDVVFFDISRSLEECLVLARATQHTRYPLCRGSLDSVIGLIHIKDLIGVPLQGDLDLNEVAKPLTFVPETMPLSQLLREMQTKGQHMALVVDEHGTTVGMITLENVLEQIVGSVLDEFDVETAEIVPEGPDSYLVEGQISLNHLNRELHLKLDQEHVDTLSGLLVDQQGSLLQGGEVVRLEGVVARVLEVRDGRAIRVRLTMQPPDEDE